MQLKSSTMVGENFEIYTSEMAKNVFKILHDGFETFEIQTSEMGKNAVKILHHGWRKF